jgi:hypothetical protein
MNGRIGDSIASMRRSHPRQGQCWPRQHPRHRIRVLRKVAIGDIDNSKGVLRIVGSQPKASSSIVRARSAQHAASCSTIAKFCSFTNRREPGPNGIRQSRLLWRDENHGTRLARGNRECDAGDANYC